jgi:hypothetical protein
MALTPLYAGVRHRFGQKNPAENGKNRVRKAGYSGHPLMDAPNGDSPARMSASTPAEK